MAEAYDSRPETIAHIKRVGTLMRLAIRNLGSRLAQHDWSKLEEPELSAFNVATPKLAKLRYGSKEYQQSLTDLGPALEHHYAEHDHHPEHTPDGIAGMSLMALIEMLCDWRAATERTHQPTDGRSVMQAFEAELDYNFERFETGEQLASVLRNTARELGLISRPSEERDLRQRQREIQRTGNVAKQRARARRAAMLTRKELPPA